MDELEITIEKIIPGGLGLGFVAGKAIFVPFCAPGDRLSVTVEKQYKSHATGTIKQIIQPASQRIDPGCAVYGNCGGCHLRHLPSKLHEEIKSGFVRESLERIGKIELAGINSGFITPSPNAGYRRRAGFKVRTVKKGVLLGFFAVASHRVVDIPACPILDPSLQALLSPLRTVIAALAGGSWIPEVECVAGDTGVGVVFHTKRPFSSPDQQLLQQFAIDNSIIQLWVQHGKKNMAKCLHNQGELRYSVDGCSLEFSPTDFIQVNSVGNQVLVEEAMAATGASREVRGGVAWDLFCGVGNFTVPLAHRFAKVRGLESSSQALQRLRENSRRLKLDNIQPLQADLFKEEGLRRLGDASGVDLLLLDPPRSGAKELMTIIAKNPPQRLVYVSCDPATFARDAGLLAKAALKLREFKGVDLFPQTKHVEVIGTFIREDG